MGEVRFLANSKFFKEDAIIIIIHLSTFTKKDYLFIIKKPDKVSKCNFDCNL